MIQIRDRVSRMISISYKWILHNGDTLIVFPIQLIENVFTDRGWCLTNYLNCFHCVIIYFAIICNTLYTLHKSSKILNFIKKEASCKKMSVDILHLFFYIDSPGFRLYTPYHQTASIFASFHVHTGTLQAWSIGFVSAKDQKPVVVLHASGTTDIVFSARSTAADKLKYNALNTHPAS